MLFIILRFEFEAENTLIEKEVHAAHTHSTGSLELCERGW